MPTWALGAPASSTLHSEMDSVHCQGLDSPSHPTPGFSGIHSLKGAVMALRRAQTLHCSRLAPTRFPFHACSLRYLPKFTPKGWGRFHTKQLQPGRGERK